MIALSFAVVGCGGIVTTKDASDDAPNGDAQGEGGFDAAPPFSCGDGGLTCNPTTEYCYDLHSGGAGDHFSCKVPDGGVPPSCDGPNTAPYPGYCGCYETDAGEVTFTVCAP